MVKIGDWIWVDDKINGKEPGMIIGFESDGKARVVVFPNQSGGPFKIVYNKYGYADLVPQGELELVPKNPYQDGFDLAKSLSSVFNVTNTDFQALYILGKRFASMCGYTGLDEGSEFIRGFGAAFSERRNSPKEIGTSVSE